MPRNYQRKTTRRQWNEDALTAALKAIEEGSMCCNRAAVTYNIPEATLRRYRERRGKGMEVPEHSGRFKSTFNAQQTRELVEYLTDCSSRGLGLTSIQVRKLAFQFAEENKIQHRFNRELKIAGIDWFDAFKAANNLSLRNPEATSIARLRGFNKVAVQKFFTILREVKQKYNFKADRIYNADESGLSTVPTKLPKIITPKGQRRVAKIVSAERGRTTTLVCAMNAIGSYVPPFFVFARQRMKPELLNGCPAGSQGIAQSSGWMTSESFLAYLKHFANFAKPSIQDPVLLLVDNHSSHISLPGINYCRENGIILVGFPPHTTHRLQPLDVSFFGPLKVYYNQVCDAFLVSNPGTAISDRNLGPLFTEAYGKAATVNNAVKGFKAVGIEPFNPLIFEDSDFSPAATTEREDPDKLIEPISTNNHSIEVDTQSDSDDDVALSILSRKIKANKTPGPSKPNLFIATEPNQDKLESTKRHLFAEDEKSLREIRPIATSQRTSTSRKKMSASIISSTPIKEALEMRQNEVAQKELRKKLRLEKKENDGKLQKQKTLLSQSETPGPSGLNIAKKKKEVNSNIQYECPGCNELYQDPPSEDWIQCSSCLRWWHEYCSAYNTGDFHCDYCI